jgi:hypothetical protein
VPLKERIMYRATMAVWYANLALFAASFFAPVLASPIDLGPIMGYGAALFAMYGVPMIFLSEGTMNIPAYIPLLVLLAGLANVGVVVAAVAMLVPAMRRLAWLRWVLVCCAIFVWMPLTIERDFEWGYYLWAVSVTVTAALYWFLSQIPAVAGRAPAGGLSALRR